MELLLLFGSKRSPSMLDLVIICILKSGKPAGSACVLICYCCHHNHIVFHRCKDTKSSWTSQAFSRLFETYRFLHRNFCSLLNSHMNSNFISSKPHPVHPSCVPAVASDQRSSATQGKEDCREAPSTFSGICSLTSKAS